VLLDLGPASAWHSTSTGPSMTAYAIPATPQPDSSSGLCTGRSSFRSSSQTWGEWPSWSAAPHHPVLPPSHCAGQPGMSWQDILVSKGRNSWWNGRQLHFTTESQRSLYSDFVAHFLLSCLCRSHLIHVTWACSF
jgi:hypothetical protein